MKALDGFKNRSSKWTSNAHTTRAVIGTDDPNAFMARTRNTAADLIDATHDLATSALLVPAAVVADLTKPAHFAGKAIFNGAASVISSRFKPTDSHAAANNEARRPQQGNAAASIDMPSASEAFVVDLASVSQLGAEAAADNSEGGSTATDRCGGSCCPGVAKST